MSDAATPLRLTATLVAQFFRFRCDRQLRFELVPERERGGVVPARNADPAAGPLVGPRAGAGLLTREGRRWERRVLRRLLDRVGEERALVGGWTPGGAARRIEADTALRALADPGDLRILVQPELRLRDPAPFARRYGFADAGVELAPAQPDLIRVLRSRGRVRFGVADIKASATVAVAHQAQVAFYSLLLEELCRAEGLDAGVERERGWIWARGGGGPKRFALRPLRYHVERFLGEDLPRVAAAHPAACEWHLAPACAGCAFVDHCRTEAEGRDDLARIPGMTRLGARVLRSRGIATVTDLVKRARRDTYTGCHALEAGAPRLQKQAQAIQWGKTFDLEAETHLAAPREDVRLVVTAEGDPVSGRCFALGLRVAGAAASRLPCGEGEEVFVAEAGTRSAEAAMFGAWLARLEAVIGEVDRLNRGGEAGRGLTLHLFCWDRRELALLHELLLRHLDRAEVQPGIGRLLRAAGGRAGLPDPAALRDGLGTVVADAVATLLALPVTYDYGLAAVSERLLPSRDAWTHRPRGEFSVPFSSQVAFERIHDVWRDRPVRTGRRPERPEAVLEEVRRTVRSKLLAIDSVLRGLRERTARDGARRGADRLQLRKEPLLLADEEAALADPRLESLRVFTRMEAVHAALAVRELHLLPATERARRFECARGLHLVERRVDGTLLFEFDPACREVKFRPGEIGLILSNEGDRSLVELDRRPWDRRKLQVELVELDAHADPPRLVVRPGPGLAGAERDGLLDLDRVCVLDRSGSDVNARRVLATLRALDQGRAPKAAVEALLCGSSPAGWVAPLGGAEMASAIDDEMLRDAAARLGRPVLNPEQALAWRAAFERPLTAVWGPPGTGKTYLLGWMLISWAEAARRAGRPLRVLVTAATHRAVATVLARAAAESRAVPLAAPPRLVKLRGGAGTDDPQLQGALVEQVDDGDLRGVLEAGDGAVVVGATVWSVWKQMRAASRAAGGDDVPVQPWFDVVVIDEASQIKVPDALIAVSSLRPGGQILLSGDHRQLAPVLHGRYGAGRDTLFGSVFGHVAAHTPALALRESRRMNRALVEYPRTHFYPGLVSMCPDRKLLLRPLPADADPLDATLAECFLDPEDAVVLCTYSGVRAAARNPFEAALAARLVAVARRVLADPASGDPAAAAHFVAEGVAVISPHRAQNSAILAAVRGAGLRDDEIPVIDTVERMQGNERDLIIVSYGVADREFAEAEAEFLLDPNRFNVAVTRARSKVIVLVSDEVLAAVPAEEGVLAGAMALLGYPAHCRDGGREVLLPGPAGEPIRARLRYRTLSGGARSGPSSA